MSVTRVHHLSLMTMCPRAGGLVNERRELVIHVLAIETAADGLILVDTGFGTEAVARPGRIPWMVRAMGRPRWSADATAVRRVEELGHRASDVRHIVITHLDVDHAGGIRDFPDATVHLHASELAAARAPDTAMERRRYLPYQIEGASFATYDEDGDTLFGLPAIRQLEGIDADIALLPLAGHSRGHSAVCVRDGERWQVHAGDAYFHHSELAPDGKGTTGLNLFQRIVASDHRQRLASREKLAAVARERGDELTVFSAHCPIELERCLAPAASAN